MIWRPVLSNRILDSITLDRMHVAALEILERTGLAVGHVGIRREIAGRAGFRADEGRVRIAPSRVEAWRQSNAIHCQAPAGAPLNPVPLGRFRCRVSNRPSALVAPDGVTVRPMTTADVIAGTKLVDVLHAQGVEGSTVGTPTDVPSALQLPAQILIGAEYSREGGSASSLACDVRTAEIVLEMDAVYGRSHFQSVWCPSPLRLDGSELDILWHFRHTVKSASVGSMPIMGLNAPCDPLATFTLAVAECIGGATILSEVLPTVPISICPHPMPMDPRTGVMAFGTPEWELLDLLHRDVFAYYGLRWDLKTLHTMSALPDAQAVAERTASAMTGMLSGFHAFGPGGMLAADEVFSPAMLVLDLDILGHAARVAHGAEIGEGLLPTELPDLIDQVIRDRMIFAEHDTTAANLRRQYWQPAVFRRLGRSQWETAGRPEIVRDAQAEADRRIAQYEYEPPQDVLRELRSIYARVQRR